MKKAIYILSLISAVICLIAGIKMMVIESVSGNSTAEFFYRGMGLLSVGLAFLIICFPMVFSVIINQLGRGTVDKAVCGIMDLSGKIPYDNSYSGIGKQFRENGTLAYEGEFKDGKMHGKGRGYYENGILGYEGEYKDGKMHGIGKMYKPNGDLKYEGEFSLGKPIK